MSKLLLVEDNEMNRDMLSRRLLRRGYEVILAVDGEEGIKIAQSESPDLILMDMSLPTIDGWEATRQLKAAPRDSGRSLFSPLQPMPCRATERKRWRPDVTTMIPSR